MSSLSSSIKLVEIVRNSRTFYKKRTAVERRLDRDFRLEHHTIRGLNKMSLTIAMSFLIMTGFALAKLKVGKTEHLASWVA